MGRTLTLELSQTIFDRLSERAGRLGRAPEDLAVEWLERAISQEEDPLLAMSGALEADVSDLGRRHDHYIGDALETEARRRSNG